MADYEGRPAGETTKDRLARFKIEADERRKTHDVMRVELSLKIDGEEITGHAADFPRSQEIEDAFDNGMSRFWVDTAFNFDHIIYAPKEKKDG